MSVCCTVGCLLAWAMDGRLRNVPRYHQLRPISCHFQDCRSTSEHESDSCKQRYGKYPTGGSVV